VERDKQQRSGVDLSQPAGLLQQSRAISGLECAVIAEFRSR
jgi:hypothetical protein